MLMSMTLCVIRALTSRLFGSFEERETVELYLKMEESEVFPETY